MDSGVTCVSTAAQPNMCDFCAWAHPIELVRYSTLDADPMSESLPILPKRTCEFQIHAFTSAAQPVTCHAHQSKR